MLKIIHFKFSIFLCWISHKKTMLFLYYYNFILVIGKKKLALIFCHKFKVYAYICFFQFAHKDKYFLLSLKLYNLFSVFVLMY